MDKIKVKEKGYNKQGSIYTNYIVESAGITIKTFEDKEIYCNFLTSWSMCIGNKSYTGETIDDLLNTLKNVSLDYCLTTYNSNLKDVLVIYTDSLRELYAFLYNYVTDKFLIDTLIDDGFGHKFHSIVDKGYFQVLDHIEFRKCWDKKCDTTEKITDWSKMMWEHLFSKDKKCYLTENASTRGKIKDACKKAKCTLGEEIFPHNPLLYNKYKSAAHGGVLYYNEAGEWGVDEPILMIEADLKSAFIFCYTLPMPITAGEKIDPKTKTNDLTLGRYTITFRNKSTYLFTIKDMDENNFDCSGDLVTQEFMLTSVDLESVKKVAKIKKIECTELYRFDSGILPKPIIDTLMAFFIDKEKYDKNSGLYKVAKIILNGGYGNCIRNLTHYEIKNYKYDQLVPQWGAFITSYCRKIIIDTGIEIYRHMYSDTDCIFCDMTQANLDVIEKWNEQARNHMKEICDLYGYPYEDVKDLGSFIIEEKNIVRFKIVGNKQYAYETAERGPEDIIVKAAGCEKQSEYSWDDIKGDKMPIGNREGQFDLILEPRTNGKYSAETTYTTNTCDDIEKLKAIWKVQSILFKMKSVL